MSLLRIYCSLRDPPLRCRWAIIEGIGKPVIKEGLLSQLPRHVDQFQIVIPASQVLITRCRLPEAARHRAGGVLAFAVEEQTVGDPESYHVSWLGSAGETDVLTVVDRQGLRAWLDAISDSGPYEIHCETLLLPLTTGEWSLAWDGNEGFVRSGEFEGATTDCGDRKSPPLSLRLMIDEAEKLGARPSRIAVYLARDGAEPDIETWQRSLGIALRIAGPWNWSMSPSNAGVSMIRERRNWRHGLTGVLPRLRLAAWVAGIALAIHAIALMSDWALLAGKQHGLRQQMETRFRGVFPDAVAVVDPAIQMRRKLAEARHAAGLPDSSDFQPMIEKVATGMKVVGAGNLRVASYESGRLMIEFPPTDEGTLRRLATYLMQSGLNVESNPASARSGSGAVVMTIRTP